MTDTSPNASDGPMVSQEQMRLFHAIYLGDRSLFSEAIHALREQPQKSRWERKAMSMVLSATKEGAPLVDRTTRQFFVSEILASPHAPTPGSHENYIAAALHNGASNCIPVLADAGFTLKNDAYKRRSHLEIVANSLGIGEWSYPEILFPKALESQEFIDLFGKAVWSYALNGRTHERGDGFFREENADRLNQWIEQANIPGLKQKMCEVISFNLASTTSSNTWWPETNGFYEAEGMPEGVARMEELGLINVDSIIRQSRGEKHEAKMEDLLGGVIARHQQAKLDETTPAAQTSSTPRKLRL